MQICEFYQRESHEQMKCFEGRWCWEIQQEQIVESFYSTTFEWIDLFGIEKAVTFTSDKANLYVLNFITLNQRFGLVILTNASRLERSLRVIEFDRERKEFIIGEDKYSEYPNYRDCLILPDRKCSVTTSGDLNFLIYDGRSGQRQHCRVDTTNRRIVKIGPDFELTTENFGYIDLNGDILSGLSKSLETVYRFDVRRRIMLDSIKIDGLASAIHWLFDGLNQMVNRGCWTSCSQIFVWSTEIETVNDQESEYFKLHSVNLETGKVATLSYKFEHRIRHICQSSEDGNLYVQCEEYVGDGYRDEHGNFVENTRNHLPPLLKHHFYRISLNESESLFFTAFKNVPKPLPDFILKLAMQRKDLPLNVYI